MKQIIQLAVLVLLVTFVSSCEKYLDFDQEHMNSKIVLNSSMNTDSVFQVHLSRSLSVIDDGELTAIVNANVAVYDQNENLIENLTGLGNGFYEGVMQPDMNSFYKIVASAEGYEEVYAQDVIPYKVLIQQIDTLGVDNEIEGIDLKLTIHFDDTPNFKNHYKLEVFVGDNVSGSFYINPLAIRSDDLSLELNEEGYYKEVYFDDLLFDGNSKELIVYVEDTRQYDDFLEVHLTSMSESAYLYEKTYRAYQNTFGNPFAQPVIVYNNVENGFGILKSEEKVVKEISF